MQEWMIAMLVISIMLIIRDMAKTILAENLPDTEELPSLQEGHPQKERVEDVYKRQLCGCAQCQHFGKTKPDYCTACRGGSW